MEARVREAAQRRKEPCVLDLTPSNVRDYEQGRLSLLHRDVEGILERHQAEYFVSRLECARIRSGFEMRVRKEVEFLGVSDLPHRRRS